MKLGIAGGEKSTAELREYAATSFLGHGVNKESLDIAIRRYDPDVIVAQGTSTDPGPYFLGSGKLVMAREVLKRDLALIIKASKEKKIPFIVSAGGAGADIHLNEVIKIVDEISREENIKLKIAVISGEINKRWLISKILSGFKAERIVDHPRLSKYLTIDDVNRSVRIVAQMGPEPIIKALEEEIDGVITGRALDVALFTALPLKKGFDKALSFHMAKILECGGLACEPGSGIDGIFGILRKDHFEVFCPNPKRRATKRSIIAHTLYERPNPFIEEYPGGVLDISNALYEEVDNKVIVSGAKWIPAKYTIKLEGVEFVGYRSICIAGVRDPYLIKSIDYVISEISREVNEYFSYLSNKFFKYIFRVYGKNAILGNREYEKSEPHEICILIDVVAETQELADSIASFISSALSHTHYPGRKSTAGNIAYPFSPGRYISVGEVYRFNIWHKLELDDPLEPFKIRVIEFPQRAIIP